MRRVIVHIDSLVLKGFRHEERHAIAEGLQQELGHLLSEPIVVQHLNFRSDATRLKAGTVRIAAGMQAVGVGESAAQTIAREITS